MATLPLDTAKVRLQLQAKGAAVPKYRRVRAAFTRTFDRLSAQRCRYSVRLSDRVDRKMRRGLIGTCLTVAREEGPRALRSGLEPGEWARVLRAERSAAGMLQGSKPE